MKRRQRGSGIVEGVVGLLLVIGGSVSGALLVLNSGAGIFFKEKLVIVANLAAQYAAALPAGSDYSGMTYAYVQSTILPAVGLSSSRLNVTVQPNPAGFPSGSAQVTVSNLFPLFGNGSIIPASIQLSDAEVATKGGASGSGGGFPLIGAIVFSVFDKNGGHTKDMLVPVMYTGNNGSQVSYTITPYTNPPLPSQLVGLPVWAPNGTQLPGTLPNPNG